MRSTDTTRYVTLVLLWRHQEDRGWKMAAFRCRRDPCGFICIILTYFSVFYADYVVIQYVLIPAYSGRWVPCERSFKEPAFGSRNSTHEIIAYNCSFLESPIATAVQKQTAFRMLSAFWCVFPRTVFATSTSIVVTAVEQQSACLLHFQSVTLWSKVSGYLTWNYQAIIPYTVIYHYIPLSLSLNDVFGRVLCYFLKHWRSLGSKMWVYIIPFSLKL